MSSLFAELKRRNVIRAGIAYLAVAWLILQASDILSNAFELPAASRRQTAKSLHDRGMKFIDVRAVKDYARGHIPGAFNLDVATELSRETLSRIVGKDEEFAMSCHGKYCTDSVYACAKAVSWGYTKVHYFADGFPAWKEAGYAIEVSKDLPR